MIQMLVSVHISIVTSNYNLFCYEVQDSTSVLDTVTYQSFSEQNMQHLYKVTHL
jgi:hypothetical protein